VSSAARQAAAERQEVGLPVVAQANQLAIERHAAVAEGLGDCCQLRKIVGALSAGAGTQRPSGGRSEVVRGSRPI
jgi:hypothetical protein